MRKGVFQELLPWHRCSTFVFSSSQIEEGGASSAQHVYYVVYTRSTFKPLLLYATPSNIFDNDVLCSQPQPLFTCNAMTMAL